MFCGRCNVVRDYKGHCKPCKRKYDIAYLERNKAKVSLYHKTYRKLNEPKIKEFKGSWYSKNKEKYRDKSYLKRYKINLEEYNRLLTQQEGVCAICKRKETKVIHGKVAELAVDHCHTTGRVRGLLCMMCNLGVGYLHDSEDHAMSVVSYLKFYRSG